MLQKTKIIAGVGVAALAVAIVPAAASYAADTSQNATYSVTISETLSLGYTAATNTATVANGSYNTEITGGTLTAITNYSGGYTLTVKDADTNNALTGTSGSISAGTTLDGSVSNWALKASGTNAVATDWFAVPVSTGTAVTVAQSSAPTSATGTTTTITYGVGVASNQAAGTYSDTVVYTIAKKTS